MTQADTEKHRAQLAAEFALGVLAGKELERAWTQYRQDSDFRAQVGIWLGRFAPLLDSVSDIEPPDGLWPAIERRIGRPAANSNNRPDVRRQLNVWRGIAAGAMAIAASLAVMVVIRPDPIASPPVEAPAQEPPMVAILGGEEEGMVMASWDSVGRNLVVASTAQQAGDPSRSRELWVIPAGGQPRSLGTLPDSNRARIRIPDNRASEMLEGATLAISLEPPGGSPTGLPTGPVIASGILERT